MRGIYRKLTAVTLIGALFVTGCSASGPKEAAPASASQLTVGITNPPLMFNPIDADGSGSSGAVFTYRYFFDSLVKTVGPLEYKMMLGSRSKLPTIKRSASPFIRRPAGPTASRSLRRTWNLR